MVTLFMGGHLAVPYKRRKHPAITRNGPLFADALHNGRTRALIAEFIGYRHKTRRIKFI